MPDCSQYDAGSGKWLVCMISKVIDENSAIINSNTIPLIGTPKTEFIGHADDAATKSIDAQQDDFFSGLTPSLVSKPGGASWQQWYTDMADRAFEIVTSSSPTTPEKQEALDRLYTIEQKKDQYIGAYT